MPKTRELSRVELQQVNDFLNQLVNDYHDERVYYIDQAAGNAAMYEYPTLGIIIKLLPDRRLVLILNKFAIKGIRTQLIHPPSFTEAILTPYTTESMNSILIQTKLSWA